MMTGIRIPWLWTFIALPYTNSIFVPFTSVENKIASFGGAAGLVSSGFVWQTAVILFYVPLKLWLFELYNVITGILDSLPN